MPLCAATRRTGLPANSEVTHPPLMEPHCVPKVQVVLLPAFCIKYLSWLLCDRCAGGRVFESYFFPKWAHASLPLALIAGAQSCFPFPCSFTQMAALFESYFFPKWHAVLRHWLANSPNYDEVTRW